MEFFEGSFLWQVVAFAFLVVLVRLGFPYLIMLIRHGGDRKKANEDMTDGDMYRDVEADQRSSWAGARRWLDVAERQMRSSKTKRNPGDGKQGKGKG